MTLKVVGSSPTVYPNNRKKKCTLNEYLDAKNIKMGVLKRIVVSEYSIRYYDLQLPIYRKLCILI